MHLKCYLEITQPRIRTKDTRREGVMSLVAAHGPYRIFSWKVHVLEANFNLVKR